VELYELFPGIEDPEQQDAKLQEVRGDPAPGGQWADGPVCWPGGITCVCWQRFDGPVCWSGDYLQRQAAVSLCVSNGHCPPPGCCVLHCAVAAIAALAVLLLLLLLHVNVVEVVVPGRFVAVMQEEVDSIARALSDLYCHHVLLSVTT